MRKRSPSHESAKEVVIGVYNKIMNNDDESNLVWLSLVENRLKLKGNHKDPVSMAVDDNVDDTSLFESIGRNNPDQLGRQELSQSPGTESPKQFERSYIND